MMSEAGRIGPVGSEDSRLSPRRRVGAGSERSPSADSFLSALEPLRDR